MYFPLHVEYKVIAKWEKKYVQGLSKVSDERPEKKI